jgi:hypothetical protein
MASVLFGMERDFFPRKVDELVVDLSDELGKLINAPQSLKERLPKEALDGELWYIFISDFFSSLNTIYYVELLM